MPPAAWPSVAANLDAFIAASLQLDAARYPSLPRFIDELARLADADDEAPDEGVIETDGEAALGRGRIMTCLLYTSPSPRDRTRSRMPSSA